LAPSSCAHLYPAQPHNPSANPPTHPSQVVLAANEKPSINDITAAELAPLLARAAAGDALLSRCLAERALRVVSSGNDLGVIDLSRVSAEVAAEAADGCDLVIMEGMGRGIETNLRAAFSCDSAKLGMIKVGGVGWCVGGGTGRKGLRFEGRVCSGHACTRRTCHRPTLDTAPCPHSVILIQHPEVARLLNGRMYDVVCKFDAAPEAAAQ